MLTEYGARKAIEADRTPYFACTKEHGSITDDRAKNVVALYGALLSMNERAGADPADAVRNAGYVVYAALAGKQNAKLIVKSCPQPMKSKSSASTLRLFAGGYVLMKRKRNSRQPRA